MVLGWLQLVIITIGLVATPDAVHHPKKKKLTSNNDNLLSVREGLKIDQGNDFRRKRSCKGWASIVVGHKSVLSLITSLFIPYA